MFQHSLGLGVAFRSSPQSGEHVSEDPVENFHRAGVCFPSHVVLVGQFFFVGFPTVGVDRCALSGKMPYLLPTMFPVSTVRSPTTLRSHFLPTLSTATQTCTCDYSLKN